MVKASSVGKKELDFRIFQSLMFFFLFVIQVVTSLLVSKAVGWKTSKLELLLFGAEHMLHGEEDYTCQSNTVIRVRG